MTQLRETAGTAAGASGQGDMAARNLGIVQGLYEAFGKGDVPAILAALSQDVAWDQGYEGTGIPIMVPRTGPEEVAGFFEALGALDVRKFEVLNMMANGDQVVAVIDLEQVATATGKRFADTELHLWTVGPDGKVAAFRHYVDTERLARIFEA